MFLSLRVSLSALLIAAIVGLPFGALLSFWRFPLKGFVVSSMNTLMGLPPVVVGLAVYLVLSRSGPLGFLSLLYTPKAMIAAQSVLALPIIISLSHAAINGVNANLRELCLTLGASRFQLFITILMEARYAVVAALVAAFGRLIAEVGAIMIVGGNIQGHTRVMTSAIVLETNKGNFELALAIGIILLLVSFLINLCFYFIQRHGGESTGGYIHKVR